MYKLLCTILVSLAVFMAAQAPASAYNKAIELGLHFNNFNEFLVRYETMMSANNSLSIEGMFNLEYDHTTYITVGGVYRWYLRDVFPAKTSGIEGFSLGPLATLGLYSYSYESESSTDFTLALGGEAAYKWVFGGFAVEPLIRLQFNAIDAGGMDGFGWGAGINLGYAW